MRARFAGDVDLGNSGWDEGCQVGNRGNLEGGADADEKINFGAVVVYYSVEAFRELFAEEDDVRLSTELDSLFKYARLSRLI